MRTSMRALPLIDQVAALASSPSIVIALAVSRAALVIVVAAVVNARTPSTALLACPARAEAERIMREEREIAERPQHTNVEPRRIRRTERPIADIRIPVPSLRAETTILHGICGNELGLLVTRGRSGSLPSPRVGESEARL